MIISLISQKGGVGKSAVARLLAVEFTKAGWNVKIADLDPAQGTSAKWKARRDRAGIQPEIAVEKFRTLDRALKEAERFDLVILDGPAHAEQGGRTMARASDLVLMPTCYGLDDMEAQVEAAYELEQSGVDAAKSGSCSAAPRDRMPKIGPRAIISTRPRSMCWSRSCRNCHPSGRATTRAGRLPRFRSPGSRNVSSRSPRRLSIGFRPRARPRDGERSEDRRAAAAAAERQSLRHRSLRRQQGRNSRKCAKARWCNSTSACRAALPTATRCWPSAPGGECRNCSPRG